MERKQIKISDVLELLNQGKGRADIRQILGLSHKEITAMFQHPKLKNKRPKNSLGFELVDDTMEEEAYQSDSPIYTPVATETVKTEEVQETQLESKPIVVEEQDGLFQ